MPLSWPLVGAAVAGLGFDIPPLAIAAAAILLPAVFISWWVGFIRRIRQGRLFSFPGRIPEIVSWLLGTRAPDWWRIASEAALAKRSETFASHVKLALGTAIVRCQRAIVLADGR